MKTLIAAVMIALTGCCVCPAPLEPDTALDAGKPAGCPEMCARLRALRCPAGNPTPGGATCEQVCRNMTEVGLSPAMQCIAKARSCQEADRCR